MPKVFNPNSPTIESLVPEAICLVCDRNGRDRHGKYRFTRNQLMTTQLDNIVAAATGSDSKEPEMAVSHALTRLVKGMSIRRIGRGEYELFILLPILEHYRQNPSKRRLPGWTTN